MGMNDFLPFLLNFSLLNIIMFFLSLRWKSKTTIKSSILMKT